MLDNLHLCPAYGRTYESAQEVLADWNAGRDFKIWGGPYCSIRDVELFKKEMYDHVAISKSGMSGDLVIIKI